LIFRGSTTVLMFLPLSLASLGPLPRNEVGAGSGLFNLSRQLGGSFGIALLTVVLDRQRAVHRAQLVEHLASTNPLLQERLHSLQIWLSQRAAGTVQPEGQVLHLLSQQVDRQATLLAYGDVFRTLAGVFLVVLPLVLLLGRPPSAVKAPP
jgi:DHA2 family multidrug resistance protein